MRWCKGEGMSTDNETIVAPSTPNGESAIAVVRVSGPRVPGLLEEIFGRTPPPRRVVHAEYRDRNGGFVDDLVYCRYRGPASYTGEDVLELYTHGNPLIVQKITEDLIARGCRSAGPGDFTRRAFLNGRMDLSQAEAVIDLIRARSDRALEAANNQLRGELGKRIQGLTDELLQVLAEIEAYIDFPEEDLPPEEQGGPAARIEHLLTQIRKLAATSHYGSILREGVGTIILGAPNAGKSSLLNRMAGRERAIVSETPGTTRDFLEERIHLGGWCIRLLDTAGLHEGGDGLEKLGMEKTIEQAGEADLFLVVVDATLPHPALPEDLRRRLGPDNTIVISNKADLLDAPPDNTRLPDCPQVLVSALTGTGMEDLEAALETLLTKGAPAAGADRVAVSARHAAALERAREALEAGLAQLREHQPPELAASELRGALEALGEIVGRVDNEAMLDKLFASFCIGK